MTTIVVSKDAMWSDSLCSSDIAFLTPKIFRIGKVLIGASGDAAAGEKFFEWFKSRDKAIALEITAHAVAGRTFDAVTCDGTSITLWDQHLVPYVVLGDHHGIGSGSPWALAAMDFGLTPEKAIEYAATRDNYTRLPIQALTLTPKRKPKRNG